MVKEKQSAKKLKAGQKSGRAVVAKRAKDKEMTPAATVAEAMTRGLDFAPEKPHWIIATMEDEGMLLVKLADITAVGADSDDECRLYLKSGVVIDHVDISAGVMAELLVNDDEVVADARGQEE